MLNALLIFEKINTLLILIFELEKVFYFFLQQPFAG